MITETQRFREEQVIVTTIENLVREMLDGPLVISTEAAEIDRFMREAISRLETGNYGVTVIRENDQVIMKKSAVMAK